MKRLMLLALPLLVAASTAAQSKALKWMDAAGAGLPAGAQMAVLSGDPGKAGMFKIQLKMPADYAVPPHHHPTDEIVRVRSGTLNYGMGDKLDKGNAGQLTDPKTHITLQSGMNHWVFTTEPTLVEVSAMGPFAITYADPKDDPRTAK